MDKKTPQPGTETYNVDKPQELNTPKYNSATEKRESAKLPAAENLNDERKKMTRPEAEERPVPDTNLGNERDEDEKEKEKIIRR